MAKKPKRTAREEIERAFHVSFKLPEQAAELLDAYRDEVLREAAAKIRNHSDFCGPDSEWGCDLETCKTLANMIDPDAA